jgi:hypothetical protein
MILCLIFASKPDLFGTTTNTGIRLIDPTDFLDLAGYVYPNPEQTGDRFITRNLSGRFSIFLGGY